MEMPNASEQVKLTEQEYRLYQAGQLAGSAQASRELASKLSAMAKALNAEADARAAEGYKILNDAIGKRHRRFAARIGGAIRSLVAPR